MKLVIIGQQWLAAELLKQCRQAGHQVLRAIAPTETDRLARTAQAAGIPVSHTPGDVPQCDLILAAHAHCYIPAQVRQRAHLGALGYHPSLLPRHRGRDAIRWAIHMREPITGGSLYWMDDQADTGPIVRQDWCHIQADDTPASLWRRALAPMGLRLFAEVLAELNAGEVLPGEPQDEALASWEPSFERARLQVGR